MTNTENLFEAIASEFLGIKILDAKKAVSTAYEAGKDEYFIIDAVRYFAENIDIKDLFNVDIVACLYDALLQEVRTEIEDLLGIDILDTGIYVSANYMCTSFDRYSKLVELLSDKIMENENSEELLDSLDNASQTLKWFFDEIEFDYQSIVKE